MKLNQTINQSARKMPKSKELNFVSERRRTKSLKFRKNLKSLEESLRKRTFEISKSIAETKKFITQQKDEFVLKTKKNTRSISIDDPFYAEKIFKKNKGIKMKMTKHEMKIKFNLKKQIMNNENKKKNFFDQDKNFNLKKIQTQKPFFQKIKKKVKANNMLKKIMHTQKQRKNKILLNLYSFISEMNAHKKPNTILLEKIQKSISSEIDEKEKDEMMTLCVLIIIKFLNWMIEFNYVFRRDSGNFNITEFVKEVNIFEEDSIFKFFLNSFSKKWSAFPDKKELKMVSRSSSKNFKSFFSILNFVIEEKKKLQMNWSIEETHKKILLIWMNLKFAENQIDSELTLFIFPILIQIIQKISILNITNNQKFQQNENLNFISKKLNFFFQKQEKLEQIIKKMKNDYVMIRKNKVMVVKDEDIVEILKFDNFALREKNMKKLTQIKFFKNFKKRKYLFLWLFAYKENQFRMNKESLERNLLIFDPFYKNFFNKVQNGYYQIIQKTNTLNIFNKDFETEKTIFNGNFKKNI